MRSIWKGHIRFSLVTIPIRIYNAVDTEETIRFQQLHKEDNGAVKAVRQKTSERTVSFASRTFVFGLTMNSTARCNFIRVILLVQ